MPYQVNSHSNGNAAYNIAGSAFGDGGVFDFSDNAFMTLAMESTSDAKGGNGGGKPGGGGSGGGSTTPTYTHISGSDNGTGYNIEIQFMGDAWTPELMASFISSSDFLSAVISGDRPDYIAADDSNNFFSQDIDDILIIASLVNIDGAGGVLGRAGPTHLIYDQASGDTSSDALPFAAIMEFDIADAETYLAAGTWGDIVFHEMMHTLGFGTLWESTGVVDLIIDDNGTKRPIDDTYTYNYTGAFATYANGGTAPQVETDGGSGTAGGHWDELTYDNELMTGYIDDPNYLDQMSLASLGDLGYEINWLAVEYTALA
jgi:hypothetical protein